MNNFMADFQSVEETAEGVFIKVYAIDERSPFPSEMVIDQYPWKYHGNGFMTIEEANRFGAKAIYKLTTEDEENEKEIKLF